MKKLKILWSVDAFDHPSHLQHEAIVQLKHLASYGEVEIEPVYILSPEQLGLSAEMASPWADQYATSAKKALEHGLKDIQIPGIKSPHVLVHHLPSLRGAVESLARYASLHSFDLILIGSHGRKGLERAFLGSFAEELLLQSEVPVLVIGAKAERKAESKIERILFPTDFSEASKTVFAQVLSWAKQLGSQVILLNVIPHPADVVVQTGVYLVSGGWIPFPVYLEKEKDKQKEVAESWKAMAVAQGVPIEIVIDCQSKSVIESVMEHAQSRKASWVAMAAQSGRVKTAVIGSISRQVVRSSHCPVWVLRSRTK